MDSEIFKTLTSPGLQLKQFLLTNEILPPIKNIQGEDVVAKRIRVGYFRMTGSQSEQFLQNDIIDMFSNRVLVDRINRNLTNFIASLMLSYKPRKLEEVFKDMIHEQFGVMWSLTTPSSAFVSDTNVTVTNPETTRTIREREEYLSGFYSALSAVVRERIGEMSDHLIFRKATMLRSRLPEGQTPLNPFLGALFVGAQDLYVAVIRDLCNRGSVSILLCLILTFMSSREAQDELAVDFKKYIRKVL